MSDHDQTDVRAAPTSTLTLRMPAALRTRLDKKAGGPRKAAPYVVGLVEKAVAPAPVPDGPRREEGWTVFAEEAKVAVAAGRLDVDTTRGMAVLFTGVLPPAFKITFRYRRLTSPGPTGPHGSYVQFGFGYQGGGRGTAADPGRWRLADLASPPGGTGDWADDHALAANGTGVRASFDMLNTEDPSIAGRCRAQEYVDGERRRIEAEGSTEMPFRTGREQEVAIVYDGQRLAVSSGGRTVSFSGSRLAGRAGHGFLRFGRLVKATISGIAIEELDEEGEPAGPPPVEPVPVDPVPVDPVVPPPAAGIHPDSPLHAWRLPPAYADIPNGSKDPWDGRSATGRAGRFMWLDRSVSGGGVVLKADASARDPAVFVFRQGVPFKPERVVLEGRGGILFGHDMTRTEIAFDGEDWLVLGPHMGGMSAAGGFVDFTDRARNCFIGFAEFVDGTGRVAYVGAGRGCGIAHSFFDRPTYAGEGPVIYLGTNRATSLRRMRLRLFANLWRLERQIKSAVEIKSSEAVVEYQTSRGGMQRDLVRIRNGVDSLVRRNLVLGAQAIKVRGARHRILENAGPKLLLLANEGNIPAEGADRDDGNKGQLWDTCEDVVFGGNDCAVLGVEPLPPQSRTGAVPISGLVVSRFGESRNEARSWQHLGRVEGGIQDRPVEGVDIARARALADEQRDVGHAALLRVLRGEA